MKSVLFTFIVLMTLNACSINKLAVRQMTPIFEESAIALYEEDDLPLAEQALASNLKLLEGLLRNDPQNHSLLMLLTQAYAGYALGFVEDRSPRRARVFYLRAREYARRALNDPAVETRDPEQLQKRIAAMEDEKMPALFWYAFAWAGYINLSLDEPKALLELPLVEVIMERIGQWNPAYFNGAVYLFKGSIYGVKPRIMGGNPEKARELFEKNLEITKGRFLLTYVYLARFYAAKVLDEAAFDAYLQKVLSFDLNKAPSLRLFNAIARDKAQRLMKMKEELF